MYSKGFFSYELISDYISSVDIFVITLCVFVVVLALFLFGSIIVFCLIKTQHFEDVGDGQENNEEKQSWWHRMVNRINFKLFKFNPDRSMAKNFWLLVMVNFVMTVLVFGILLLKGQGWLFAFIFIFSISFCSCIALIFQRNIWQGLSNYVPPLVLMFLTVFVPVVYHRHMSDILDVVLRQYRIGGGISAKIINTKTNLLIADGCLLFYTPKNLYIVVIAEDADNDKEGSAMGNSDNVNTNGDKSNDGKQTRKILKIIKNDSDYELDIDVSDKMR